MVEKKENQTEDNSSSNQIYSRENRYGAATGGTVSTVSNPIAALNSDGSVNSGSSAAFPTTTPTAVTASPGVDPTRYNAPGQNARRRPFKVTVGKKTQNHSFNDDNYDSVSTNSYFIDGKEAPIIY